ncbi:MAG: ribosome small subunit-dependent GTPase A [Oscillospiraceae bacterium]|jgi:ribosome biogenesis GTPase|nr:ribosome small subunit-dependent GTPase A [Oscillospiraceae bacterium]
MQLTEGLIVKAISGFYYVVPDGEPEGLLACTAKGVFRKRGTAPLAGDRVRVEAGVVAEILPRKNELLRPPAANLDQALLTVSAAKPAPNALVLDKLIAVCEYKGIEPVIIITKTDLCDGRAFGGIYERAGFQVLYTGEDSPGREAILALLRGKVSIFIGNSGVGKSTMLNRLFPGLSLATAAISDKLGRGRHTTRHVELFPLPGGGYAADTPGFSTVELERYGAIRKEELAGCFREFKPYEGRCQFADCAHLKEKGCAVLAALDAGEIPASRHESYLALYEAAQKIPDWAREGRKGGKA